MSVSDEWEDHLRRPVPERARPRDVFDVLSFVAGLGIAAHETLLGGTTERPFLLGLSLILMGYGKIADTLTKRLGIGQGDQ